jgi:hypothetical protein
MGFGNRVRQRGKETYKLKLTNKNYKYSRWVLQWRGDGDIVVPSF